MIRLQLANKQNNTKKNSYNYTKRYSYDMMYDIMYDIIHTFSYIVLLRDETANECSEGQRISDVSHEFISWQSEQV